MPIRASINAVSPRSIKSTLHKKIGRHFIEEEKVHEGTLYQIKTITDYLKARKQTPSAIITSGKICLKFCKLLSHQFICINYILLIHIVGTGKKFLCLKLRE